MFQVSFSIFWLNLIVFFSGLSGDVPRRSENGDVSIEVETSVTVAKSRAVESTRLIPLAVEGEKQTLASAMLSLSLTASCLSRRLSMVWWFSTVYLSSVVPSLFRIFSSFSFTTVWY